MDTDTGTLSAMVHSLQWYIIGSGTLLAVVHSWKWYIISSGTF